MNGAPVSKTSPICKEAVRVQKKICTFANLKNDNYQHETYAD